MDFRAEVVGSESRMRESWAMRDVRWVGGLVGLYCVVGFTTGFGIGGCEPYASGLYGIDRDAPFRGSRSAALLFSAPLRLVLDLHLIWRRIAHMCGRAIPSRGLC